jgi:hypothetical protein
MASLLQWGTSARGAQVKTTTPLVSMEDCWGELMHGGGSAVVKDGIGSRRRVGEVSLTQSIVSGV